MSYSTWHNYGYGICVDDIKSQDVERLQALLDLTPKFKAKIEGWLSEREIQEPSWDDYMEFDQDFCLGLATILNEIIVEAEGIELTACDDYDGITYLLYKPLYPWHMGDIDRGQTEESLAGIFRHYIGILTDDPIEIDYQEVEKDRKSVV